MIDSYVTVNEIAKKWEVKPRNIPMMCLKGKIKGAEKIGNIWMIPVDAERPLDERIKSGKYIKEKES